MHITITFVCVVLTKSYVHYILRDKVGVDRVDGIRTVIRAICLLHK